MAKASPPPTGSLPTFFAGSTFKSSLDNRPDGPIVLSPVPGKPPDTLFNGLKDVGRSKSATQSFVSKLR